VTTKVWRDGVEAPSEKARPGTSLAAQSADLHGAFTQEGPVWFAAGRGFSFLCSQANSGRGKSETYSGQDQIFGFHGYSLQTFESSTRLCSSRESLRSSTG
jgi:hypothetical protein